MKGNPEVYGLGFPATRARSPDMGNVVPSNARRAQTSSNFLANFRIADNAELTQRQDQACSQRSESPRFPEESLHLGMRAAVDQVL